MLYQSWTSPAANHYYTLPTVCNAVHQQPHLPDMSSSELSVLFWFLRYLTCSFVIADQCSISPICIYLSVLPSFPPSLPSASAEAHPHTRHSSSAAGSSNNGAISLLTWAVLLAQFVVPMHYFWGTHNFTKILISPTTILSQKKEKQLTTLCKWGNYNKVKQFFLTW